jgi:exonuclease SbcC
LPPESEMVRLQSEIRDMERKVSEIALPELPTGIVFNPELLSESLTRRDEIGRQIATAQNKMEQNKQRIDDLERYLSEHADIVSKVQSQEEAVRTFEHKLKVVRQAVEGIQATAEALRTRIRPSVQGHMASILPALTSSRYRAAILDENYGLQVWDPEAGEYKPRDVYSGGTEDQFLLAMRLAFALALLPEVKGQKPEFVFLDEPLGSSDDVRRSGIVEYLASDLSKKFKQIFVISHVGGLEEYAQNTITLDDGRVV